MSDVVLKVENLYKQYRLGLVGTGTLKDDLQRFWANVRGKEDPLSKIGEENQLDQAGGDYVWALKDINFEVKRGEILGIIGKNGAGKSTLLKILSKVTGPTKGNIYVDGRIASLLEVGTGFHPELTGRENIFLNGAILGMKKREIRSKLDEIVDFSGVEKYLDTPVKRYSSGMYVRLAFAVAAHLEPEILIVDEVLAVGDVEFQKKAIGKMQDVSKGQGRTVLFVSHNMGAVQNLCDRGIILKNGELFFEGNTNKCIQEYLDSSVKKNNFRCSNIIGINYLEAEILYPDNKKVYKFAEEITISLKISPKTKIHNFVVSIGFKSIKGEFIRTIWSNPIDLNNNVYMKIKESLLFGSGSYYLCLGISSSKRVLFYQEDILKLKIDEVRANRNDYPEIIENKLPGQILNTSNITIKKF